MSRLTRQELLKGAMSGAAMGIAGTLPGAGLLQRAIAQENGISDDPGTEYVLRDAIVLTMDDERRAFQSGYVWIRGGRIYRVGATADLSAVPDGIEVRSASNRLIMPGLINCHTHLSNGILRGIFDEMPLDVWFSKGMWPVLDELDGAAGEAGAQISLLELMSMGVTTTAVGEFGTPHKDLPDGTLTAVEKSGIRAVVSRMTVDGTSESPAEFIPPKYRERPSVAADEVRRLQKRFNSTLISVAPEALGPVRCTPEMVRAMYDVARETESHFLMHVAGSPEERDAAHQTFGHGSIIELERMGVLGPKTLFAHAVWLDDEEIALLAETETGISHNPVSNAYYATGIARLPDLLTANVRVGLGVDGASTNNGQNIWETMKMAMLFQKQELMNANFGSAELALELMTRGGAHALHMEDEIGSLEEGKRADFIVIDTGRISLSPLQTVVSNLVYSNDPWAVRDVYVNGDAVVSDGVHISLDRATVVDQGRQALGKLLNGTRLDSYLAERSSWKWE